MNLAAVFGTIEKHRGIISVESQVGVGSTFSIYLPAVRTSQQAVTRGKQPDQLPEVKQTGSDSIHFSYRA